VTHRSLRSNTYPFDFEDDLRRFLIILSSHGNAYSFSICVSDQFDFDHIEVWFASARNARLSFPTFHPHPGTNRGRQCRPFSVKRLRSLRARTSSAARGRTTTRTKAYRFFESAGGSPTGARIGEVEVPCFSGAASRQGAAGREGQHAATSTGEERLPRARAASFEAPDWGSAVTGRRGRREESARALQVTRPVASKNRRRKLR
jgi:hypothetical protein